MIVTSEEHLPLSLVTLAGDLTKDDVDALGAYYRSLHARGQRYASLLDVRRVAVPNAAIRRAFADMSNGFAGEDEKHTVCVALLLDSVVLVGVVRAVQWFLRTKTDLRSFSSTAEVYGYLSDKLAKEGLVIPPGARAAIEKLS